MSLVRLNSKCIECLLKKHLNNYPKTADESARLDYTQKLLNILANAEKEKSAPEILYLINGLQKDLFGLTDDFSKEKKYFNSLMLSLEEEIEKDINRCENPLKTALNFALLGNYIDFGALDSVDEDKLRASLKNAKNLKYKDEEFENLQKELKSAKSIVYLTDNCGEILLDKLFIKTIKSQNPNINVTVIVRGAPVLNDSTIEDAKQVGMDKIANVKDNGSAIAGTCLSNISNEAFEYINNADLIIAKGQANFETLRYSEKNIYYIFMCKCQMFAERFGVERMSGMLLNDLRMK